MAIGETTSGDIIIIGIFSQGANFTSRPYRCQLCDVSYFRKYQLTKHEQKGHASQPGKNLKYAPPIHYYNVLEQWKPMETHTLLTQLNKSLKSLLRKSLRCRERLKKKKET